MGGGYIEHAAFVGNKRTAADIEMLGAHGADIFFIREENDIVRNSVRRFFSFKGCARKGDCIISFKNGCFCVQCVYGSIGDGNVAFGINALRHSTGSGKGAAVRDEDTAPVSNHDGRRTVTCGRNGGVFHFHHGTGGNSGAGGMISRSNNGRILQADIGALAVTVSACRSNAGRGNMGARHRRASAVGGKESGILSVKPGTVYIGRITCFCNLCVGGGNVCHGDTESIFICFIRSVNSIFIVPVAGKLIGGFALADGIFFYRRGNRFGFRFRFGFFCRFRFFCRLFDNRLRCLGGKILKSTRFYGSLYVSYSQIEAFQQGVCIIHITRRGCCGGSRSRSALLSLLFRFFQVFHFLNGSTVWIQRCAACL